MGKELEYKYAPTAGDGSFILERFPGDWEQVTMESTYYDTLQGDLARKRYTLRLRKENGQQVITCKTPGGGNARNEWEYPAGSLAEGIPALLAMGAPEELASYLRAGLVARCGAAFTRMRRTLRFGDGEAELAWDKGELRGGAMREPLLEIELELKSGDEAAFTAWCGQMAEELKLRTIKESKFARAAALREK